MININYINFPIYSICILLSIFLNFIVVYKALKFKEIEKIYILPLIMYQAIGILFGAKFLAMLTSIDSISEISFDRLSESGFSSYGGLIGELILTAIFALIYKLDIKKVFEATLLGVPLMYAVSKIGCLFSGCCYGFSYSGFLAISYNNYPYDYWGGTVFPVQLCEIIVFLIIFIVLLKIRKYDNLEIPMCLILCGIAKFLLDFLRDSHGDVVISLNQIISLIFIIIGVAILKFCKIKQK